LSYKKFDKSKKQGIIFTNRIPERVDRDEYRPGKASEREDRRLRALPPDGRENPPGAGPGKGEESEESQESSEEPLIR
jgi:hypothetical protein